MMLLHSEEDARSFCETQVDSEAMARFVRFIDMLRQENLRQNLVSNASLDTVWQRHVADSLQLLLHVPHEATPPWLDLGTGAGPPGIIIAIARPDYPMVLVESRKRRAAWLEAVCDEFSLHQCQVQAARLEDVETTPCGVISARAFAPLPKLLKLSARFSTQETVWLLPKGRSAGQELSEQPEAVRKLFHVEQSRTDSQAGILIGRGITNFQ